MQSRRSNCSIKLIALVFAASLCGFVRAQEAPPASGGLEQLGEGKAEAEKVKASGYFTAAAGGKPAMLHVTAEIAPGWHIYSITQKPGGPNKTKIKVNPSNDFKVTGPFKAEKEPVTHKYQEIWPDLPVEEHEGKASWSAPIEPATGVDPTKLEITGAVNAQVCAEECLPPKDYKFVAKLKTAADAGAEKTDSKGTSAGAAMGGASTGFDASLVAQNVRADYPLSELILGAFFGGMLLNLMPCVFPVIGLKILSFAEQSHHDRGRLLILNLWYSLGVVAVFIGLAAVAIALRQFVGLDFKYGSQNGIQGYAIGMAAVMFVMGISLLGVWEIPIPGFLGSGKAGQAMSHEGAAGAVAKGAITTLLGASCSGPLVAIAFAFALDRSTPAWATFATFALIGIGMATPYLILGANPRLLRFLPKPGEWMDTFKHVCGFVLLAAMVWVLTWLKLTHVAPTVAFLVGLWAACWVIGRVPHTESGRARLRAWLVGCTIAVVTSWYAFGSLAPSMDERYEQLVSNEVAKRTQVVVENSNTGEHLSWQPFSTNLLKQLTGDHKTVMVDFTAEWCVNCKTLEYLVLNTPEIRSAVTRNGVVPLLADYTDTPPELTEMLSLLKAGGVPVLAIFPAGDPNNPIVFRSGYTKQTLIEALDKAGPSQSIAEIGTATLN